MTISRFTSDVRFEIDGQVMPAPIHYQFANDLLTPSDAVSVEWPMSLSLWRTCALDAPLVMYIDDAPVLGGLIDEVKENNRGTFGVTALDRIGRGLVKESVDGAGFSVRGLTLEQAVMRCVGPWFERVEFHNARDRRLRRGRGRIRRAAQEPLTRREAAVIPRRIAAGETRFGALESILEPLGLLAWASGDGTTLIVTRPHVRQEPQYAFFDHPGESQVMAMSMATSNAGRYALVEVSGTGRATGGEARQVEAGERASEFAQRNRIGIARDTSGDFRHPARLFLAEEVASTAEARALAHRVMRESLAESRTVTVTVPGHGQFLDSSMPTTYAPDTVASIEKWVRKAPDDDTPAQLFNAEMYISSVTFSGSRDGQTTELALTPLEIELT